jgi:hypothetical protein
MLRVLVVGIQFYENTNYPWFCCAAYLLEIWLCHRINTSFYFGTLMDNSLGSG